MELGRKLTAVLGLFIALSACAHTPAADEDKKLQEAVAQLRHAEGTWDVITRFLRPDGSVAREAAGSYHFEWVVPDRVLIGSSRIPDLQQASGILFFINEAQQEIEMVSVGPDGRLWRMRGPLAGETRYTEPYETADGGEGQLRFTRFNVERDRFESRMEYSTDGGATWTQGNHQLFTRSKN